MYVDVLFAFNFMMDLLVLLSVRLMLAKRGLGSGAGKRQWLRLLAAAGFGAAMSCLLTALQLILGVKRLSEGVGALLTGIWICVGMTWIAYRPRTRKRLLYMSAAVYGSAFLIGGSCGWLQAHMRTASYTVLLLAAVVISAVFLRHRQRVREEDVRFAKARIFCGGKTVCVKALLDTGNSLTLSGTRTPVSVIGCDALMPALDGEQRRQYEKLCTLAGNAEAGAAADAAAGWTLVLYHSVGCPYGILPAVCVPHAYITAADGSGRHLERMWLAVSDKPLSAHGQYEMLLHPEHLPLTE